MEIALVSQPFSILIESTAENCFFTLAIPTRTNTIVSNLNRRTRIHSGWFARPIDRATHAHRQTAVPPPTLPSSMPPTQLALRFPTPKRAEFVSRTNRPNFQISGENFHWHFSSASPGPITCGKTDDHQVITAENSRQKSTTGNAQRGKKRNSTHGARYEHNFIRSRYSSN